MYRLLLTVVLCLVTGVAGARLFAVGWHLGWMLAGIVLLLMLYVVPWRQGWIKSIILGALFVCGGLFYGTSEAREPPELEPYVGQEIGVRGRVADPPALKEGGWRFRLELSEVFLNGKWHPVAEQAIVKAATPGREPHYGDLLEISSVRLDRPSEARNPGAFDARAYYERQGIAYALTLSERVKWSVTGNDERGLTGRLFVPLRERLLAVMRDLFPPQQQAIIAGLLLGITDEIDTETMESFRELGVVHILAVSGANVALIILPLLMLLKRAGVSRRMRYSIAIAVILLYGGITGGGPSVLRACIMSVIWCLASLFARDPDPLTSWSLALGLSVLLNPRAVGDLGWQLTFGVTLGLLLLPDHLGRLWGRFQIDLFPPKVVSAFLFTLAAELVSVPLLLTANPTFTPLSLLANLYIIPILALLVPLAAVSVLLGLIHPGIAYFPGLISSWLLAVMVDPLTWIGEKGWLSGHYRAPATLWLCLYYAWWLLFALCKPAPLKKIALSALALLLAVGVVMRMSPERSLRVTFLDVGQGDSAVIQMPGGEVWLVDGGGIPGFKKSTFDVGKQIVVPALARMGIDRIDLLLMTHADEDHVRGLAAVLDAFPVQRVIVSDVSGDKPFYRDLLAKVNTLNIPLERAFAGQMRALPDGVTATFLNPPSRLVQGTRSDSNSNSLVFTLTYGAHTILFAADVEGDREPGLSVRGHVDVLKVAHHGSSHSSTAPFLQAISPTHAVLSVGAHNSYGHPAAATLGRLRAVGAAVWRTDRQGAIRCETDGMHLTVTSFLPQ